jgi:hypothetical protein
VLQSWVYSQAIVIMVMSLRLVLVGHFDQLSNLMLVLTFAFYISLLVFFSLSVITEETIYLFIPGLSPVYHIQTLELQK